MAKILIVIFSLMTLGTAYMTYNNVGMQKTAFEPQTSIRTGSTGSYGGYIGGSSGGGYRSGK